MSIELAKKDFLNYSIPNLLLIANRFGVSTDLPAKDLITGLAEALHGTHVKGTMTGAPPHINDFIIEHQALYDRFIEKMRELDQEDIETGFAAAPRSEEEAERDALLGLAVSFAAQDQPEKQKMALEWLLKEYPDLYAPVASTLVSDFDQDYRTSLILPELITITDENIDWLLPIARDILDKYLPLPGLKMTRYIHTARTGSVTRRLFEELGDVPCDDILKWLSAVSAPMSPEEARKKVRVILEHCPLAKKGRKALKGKKRTTGYMLFSQQERETLKSKKPDISFAEISKAVQEKWKEASKKEKNTWNEKAKKQNEEIKREPVRDPLAQMLREQISRAYLDKTEGLDNMRAMAAVLGLDLYQSEANVMSGLQNKQLTAQEALEKLKDLGVSYPYQTKTEVMTAMRKKELPAVLGMALMKTLPATVAPKVPECEPPEDLKDCTNEKDLEQLECWSNKFRPNIKIKFLNPIDFEAKATTLCMRSTTMHQIATDPANQFRAWYTSPGWQEQRRVMTEQGKGGAPSLVEKYVKVFNYYLANDQHRLATMGAGDYIGYPLYTQKRVGTEIGTVLEVGAVHGAAPGETIYYIVPAGRPIEEQRLEIIDKINDIHGQKAVPSVREDLSIKEAITLNDKDTIPVLDRTEEDRELRGVFREGVYIIGPNIDLSGANLRGANLSHSNLRGATMDYALLEGTNLNDADLTIANLSYASMFRSTLVNADLTDAILYQADLTDSDLTGSTFWDAADTEDAIVGGAILPATVSPEEEESPEESPEEGEIEEIEEIEDGNDILPFEFEEGEIEESFEDYPEFLDYP